MHDPLILDSTTRRPVRLLFVLSAMLGWRTYAQNLLTILKTRADIDADIVRFEKGDLSFFDRIAGSRVRLRDGYRVVLPLILSKRRWGRGMLRRMENANYDGVFVASHALAAGFADGLPAATPLFTALDVTMRRPVRVMGSLLKHSGGEEEEQRIFHRSAMVFPLSRWAAESVVEDYDMPCERVEVIPTSVFPPSQVIRGDLPEGRPPTIGFVGNPFEDKGGLDLLAVHQEHLRERANLHIVTRSVADHHDLSNVLHYRHVPNRLMMESVMPSWDIFCLPTHADMSSFVTAEAHAAGLPAVVTRTGGVPEICLDGVTGFVIAPKDRAALRDRLMLLIEDVELRRRMGSAARAHALANLDAHAHLNRMLDRMIGVIRFEAAGGAMAMRIEPAAQLSARP